MEEENKELVVPATKYGLTIEQQKAVREIWDKYKGELSPKQIFLQHLKDYFDVPEPENFEINGKPFFNFARLVRCWKLEDENYVSKISAENLSVEEVEEINENNAKRLVVLLQNTITKYEKKPEQFNKLSFGDISKLYQIIQQINNATERIEIQRNKLKLDTAKTFLPYTRMSDSQLARSEELILKSIKRLRDNNEVQLPASSPREGGKL